MQIAKYVRIVTDGSGERFVLVRSLRTPEDARAHGYRFEWECSQYSFVADPSMTQDRYGLSPSEYAAVVDEAWGG